jgi:hypothetical protein
MLGAGRAARMLPPKLCPACGGEYVHTVEACPACGVRLVVAGEPIAVQELPPASQLRRIRSASFSWARSFSERLVEAGIAHRVELDPAPERGERGERSCSVFVREQDVELAAQLDAEHVRAQIPDLPEDFSAAAADEGRCPACGEPADLEAAECPSCGLAFRDAE